jgi:hypothetical protein
MNQIHSHFEFAFALFGALAFAGCGHGHGGALPTHAKNLSTATIQRMQNSAGCLDLTRLLKEVVAAKQVKAAETDIQVTNDGSPRSRQFERDLEYSARDAAKDPAKQGEEFLEEMKAASEGAQQVGCEKLIVTEGDKTIENKIFRSSPTVIQFSESDGSHPGSGPDLVTFELVGDGEMSITTSGASYPITHPCGSPDSTTEVKESHPVSYVLTVTWGETAVDPEISAAVRELAKQAPASGESYGTGQFMADEQDYCKAAGH